MRKRMTDERLAEIDSDYYGITLEGRLIEELIDGMKAEREKVAELKALGEQE